VRNMEIAWVFYEIADLLEFKGEEFFKIRAYRRAARAIAGLDRPVKELYAGGALKEVPGLGKNIIAKIGELLDSGECRLHKELKEEIPASLTEMMSLPGLGPKRARLIYEQLGITTVTELDKAARAGKIRELPGMGAKIEQELVRNISRMKKQARRLPLGAARELALALHEYLEQMVKVEAVTVTGDIRRWAELVDSIDLLAVVRNPDDAAEILDAFLLHPGLGEATWRDKDRVQAVSRWGVPVELIAVPREQYWFTLLWSTGSEQHFRRLQMTAWRQGWRLDRFGMVSRRDRQTAPVSSEEDIYRLLGLQYVAPELRENYGEINAAARGELPRLLELADIRGDLHVHTDWSDGACSIEEMVQQAREKGYSYLAITDHSTSLKIARGLSRERLLAQHEKIRELNKKWEDFYVLTGVEVDILADGSLDHPDEVLARVDLVIASIHSGFKQDKDRITRRILAAIENDHVDIIGHPTGRLLGHREPYAVDVEEIIEAAARHNKVLEINASPDRLDLSEFYVQLARESGVPVAINTDAHDRRRLDEMVYGVSVARRAWLEPSHVLNTLPLPDLLRVLRK